VNQLEGTCVANHEPISSVVVTVMDYIITPGTLGRKPSAD
jgi:hypothetical protein